MLQMQVLKAVMQHRWFHPVLLLIWMGIGAILRFTNLSAKPPWNDEIATMGFSLGNSFSTIPIDRPISLSTLLQPLQLNPGAGIHDVIHYLMNESTHPPIYFVLTHLWLQLFPSHDGLVSVWAARSLAALFGVTAIPAIFALAWLTFGSLRVGQIAALLMAVSPYGIYLAQEARHYTLAILLIIASLSCLVVSLRSLSPQAATTRWISPGIAILWTVINSLGMAVHYFFSLTLAAEAFVVLWMLWTRKGLSFRSLVFFIAVGLGSLAGGLVWLPKLGAVSDSGLTQWIFDGDPFSNVLATLARWFGWLVTMLVMLPVEGVPLPIAIASGIIMISFLLWIAPACFTGWKRLAKQQREREVLNIFGGYCAAAILLFAIIIYGFGADLTIAARYHFVYFPAVLVLMAAVLSTGWDRTIAASRHHQNARWYQQVWRSLRPHGKAATVVTSILGCLGALTVAFNLGYQKPDEPDVLVPIIYKNSHHPVLIANTHQTFEQTREMIGLGLALQLFYDDVDAGENAAASQLAIRDISFLLAHQDSGTETGTHVLQQAIDRAEKPLDLWLVNFLPIIQPTVRGCVLDTRPRPKMHGYDHRLYHCL